MPCILSHAVTRYDRENQAWATKGKRRYHNPYALGIYLQRVEECNGMMAQGMPREEALRECFEGALLAYILKFIAEKESEYA